MTPICAASFLLLTVSAFEPPQKPDRPKPPQAPTEAAVEVARISLVTGEVEVQRGTAVWTRAAEDQPLSIGDRVRTLQGATARLEFPWTVVAMSDNSEVSLQKNRLLTLQLDSGRIDVDPEEALLRIVTAEATISGTGRTLVRRDGALTFVASYNGGATVESPVSLVRLGVGKGTLVKAAEAPSEPVRLPQPPRVTSPGSDPRYIRPGEIVHLTWTGTDPVYHLEVLPIDSDVPVVSIDVAATEYELKLSWIGTFRWRISGRNGSVESVPSGEGLICVVEK